MLLTLCFYKDFSGNYVSGAPTLTLGSKEFPDRELDFNSAVLRVTL